MDPLTLDWLHIVALLGAVQGVFLAVVLAARRRNRTANRVLAVAMLTFSISLATSVYHAAALIERFPHFFGVGYPLLFLFGPLVYLYAVTAADRTRGLRRYDALHFLPFAIIVIAGLPIYLSSPADKVALWHRLVRGERPPLIAIADPLKYVSGVGYALVTLLFLHRHRERVKESYSSTERVNLRWLLLLGVATAAIWLLALAFPLLESAGVGRVARGDDYIALAVAVLVYATGYMGLRQPEVFRYETAEYPVPVRELGEAQGERPESPAPASREPEFEAEPDVPPPSSPAVPRYERSGLTERQARRLRDALLVLMESESPWRDPDLTLADLAGRLSTTPHKLSELLNSQIGQTFYDFVNGYRVREVQRRIAAGEANRVTMLSLALDAGFASKSTFNQVFKKHTSRTPSDYRQTAGV